MRFPRVQRERVSNTREKIMSRRKITSREGKAVVPSLNLSDEVQVEYRTAIDAGDSSSSIIGRGFARLRTHWIGSVAAMIILLLGIGVMAKNGWFARDEGGRMKDENKNPDSSLIPHPFQPLRLRQPLR